MPKTDLHPTYFPEAKVSCACGNVYTIGATKPEIQVEICAKCHPFYTGEKKLVDVAGRVERFKSRASKKSAAPKVKKVKAKKAPKVVKG
jgi:large subunit ribosomal protein L31